MLSSIKKGDPTYQGVAHIISDLLSKETLIEALSLQQLGTNKISQMYTTKETLTDIFDLNKEIYQYKMKLSKHFNSVQLQACSMLQSEETQAFDGSFPPKAKEVNYDNAPMMYDDTPSISEVTIEEHKEKNHIAEYEKKETKIIKNAKKSKIATAALIMPSQELKTEINKKPDFPTSPTDLIKIQEVKSPENVLITQSNNKANLITVQTNSKKNHMRAQSSNSLKRKQKTLDLIDNVPSELPKIANISKQETPSLHGYQNLVNKIQNLRNNEEDLKKRNMISQTDYVFNELLYTNGIILNSTRHGKNQKVLRK